MAARLDVCAARWQCLFVARATAARQERTPRLTDRHDRAAEDGHRATQPLLADATLMMRLVELADSLQRDDASDFPAVIQAINLGAVDMVAGAQYAGISVLDSDGHLTSVGPTHRYPTVLDTVQGETREGPSLSVQHDQQLIRIDDLQQDLRWPEFRRLALVRTPIRSIVCVHMFGETGPTATLSFQADRPNAFTAESVEMAQIMAAHATMAWNLRQREQQFSAALLSRDIIGQAKGMLMERFGVDAVDAFELLKRLSQESNMKLAQVAQNILATRQADNEPRG